MRLPVMQFLLGAAAVLFGAWLIGEWAVGLACVVLGMLVTVDALFRDWKVPPEVNTVGRTFEEIVEGVKRAP